MPSYRQPDLSGERLRRAPDARRAPAPGDGVLPEGFFSTTNLPTYVRVEGGHAFHARAIGPVRAAARAARAG
jgi:hypothetical protein